MYGLPLLTQCKSLGSKNSLLITRFRTEIGLNRHIFEEEVFIFMKRMLRINTEI